MREDVRARPVRNLDHVGHESVATPGQRRNEPRTLGFVAQQAPEHENLLCEIRFFDDGIRPDKRQQFVLGDDPGAMLHEHAQRLDRFWRGGDEDTAIEQAGGVEVEAKPLEFDEPG